MYRTVKYFNRAVFCLLILLILFGSIHRCAAQTSSPAPLAENPAVETHHQKDHGPGMFDISPVILVSQTLNFFVLLLILQKLLFGPVGKIIEERRAHIGRIKIETEEEHARALALKAVYENHLANIEEEMHQIRQNAILEARQETEKILEEAKARAEDIIERGELELFMERQTAWAGLREDVVKLTLLAAEKVVEQSLDDELHHELINRTIDRLEHNLPDHL